MVSSVEAFLESTWSWLAGFLSAFPQNYIVPNLQLIIEVTLLVLLAFVLGRVVKTVTIRLLSVTGIKRASSSGWAGDLLKAIGYRGSIVTLIGDMLKWFIYIVIFGVIIDVLGFPGLVSIVGQIASYVPRFAGAILIVVVGFLLSDFIGKVFEEAGRRYFGDETISAIAGGLSKNVAALASVIIALSLIGLDSTSLNIILAMLLVGATSILLISLKDILPEFSAGMHLRRTVRPGEHVRIGTHRGIVERMDPLSVTLREGETRTTLPNSAFLRQPVERSGRERGKRGL